MRENNNSFWITPYTYSVLHFTLELPDVWNSWFFVWHNQILWQSITFSLIAWQHKAGVSVGIVQPLEYLWTKIMQGEKYYEIVGLTTTSGVERWSKTEMKPEIVATKVFDALGRSTVKRKWPDCHVFGYTKQRIMNFTCHTTPEWNATHCTISNWGACTSKEWLNSSEGSAGNSPTMVETNLMWKPDSHALEIIEVHLECHSPKPADRMDFEINPKRLI